MVVLYLIVIISFQYCMTNGKVIEIDHNPVNIDDEYLIKKVNTILRQINLTPKSSGESLENQLGDMMLEKEENPQAEDSDIDFDLNDPICGGQCEHNCKYYVYEKISDSNYEIKPYGCD